MSQEENKVLIRRFVETMNRGELDKLEQYFAPDYTDSTRPGAYEGAIQLFTMFKAAFPDFQINVDDMIAEGDKVVVRLNITGTHRGEFMGLPPTGKFIRLTAIDINRIQDGKLVERWANQDDLGMLQQLGIIPSMQSSQV